MLMGIGLALVVWTGVVTTAVPQEANYTAPGLMSATGSAAKAQPGAVVTDCHCKRSAPAMASAKSNNLLKTRFGTAEARALYGSARFVKMQVVTR